MCYFDYLFQELNYNKIKLSDTELVYIVQDYSVIHIEFKKSVNDENIEKCLSVIITELTPNRYVNINCKKIDNILKKQSDFFEHSLCKLHKYKSRYPHHDAIKKRISEDYNLDFTYYESKIPKTVYNLIIVKGYDLINEQYRCSFAIRMSEKEKIIRDLIKLLKNDVNFNKNVVFEYAIKEVGFIDKYDAIAIQGEILKNIQEYDLHFVKYNLKNQTLLKEQPKLYELVKKAFPYDAIEEEYTPNIYIDGKRVRFRYDIYLPYKKVAIEYQGIQHYSAVDYFGGQIGLYKTKERDEYKRIISEQNNIEIIYIRYDEVVDAKTLKQTVEQAVISRYAKNDFLYKKIDIEDNFWVQKYYTNHTFYSLIHEKSLLNELDLSKVLKVSEIKNNTIKIPNKYIRNYFYHSDTAIPFENIIYFYIMSHNEHFKYTRVFKSYPEIFYYCIKCIYENCDIIINTVIYDIIPDTVFERRWAKLLESDIVKLKWIVEEGNLLAELIVNYIQKKKK